MVRQLLILVVASVAVSCVGGCEQPEVVTVEIICPSCSTGPGLDAEAARDEYQRLLGSIVVGDGRVDYDKLCADPNASRRTIEDYIASVESTIVWVEDTPGPPSNDVLEVGMLSFGEGSQRFTIDEYERLACFINMYNACTLRAVLEFYPIHSIDDCPVDFFRECRVSLFGWVMPLSEWSRVIRAEGDWRVVFALSSPTFGGPILSATLYDGKQLEQQLDDAFVDYLCSCAGMRIDHGARKVLLGEPLYELRNRFVQLYPTRFRAPYVPAVQVSVVTSLMPHALPTTQRILGDVIGYKAGLLPPDNRLNRKEWDPLLTSIPDMNSPEYADYPCGSK